MTNMKTSTHALWRYQPTTSLTTLHCVSKLEELCQEIWTDLRKKLQISDQEREKEGEIDQKEDGEMI